MNSKLIKVGKATLATVMATSVGMSSFTLLSIFAEESKDVTNEELPVEPVNEEAKATNKEQPLEEEKLLKKEVHYFNLRVIQGVSIKKMPSQWMN